MIFLTKEITDPVVARLEQLRDEIAQSISSHGLTASGRTAQSMYVVATDFEVSLYGRNFFAALETGSSHWSGVTGVRCTFYEFKGIIRNWAMAKGLNFGQHKEHERTLGAITATIIRKGTRQKRSGQRIDVYTTLVNKAVADCSDMVAEQVGVKVDNIIHNLWGAK